MGAELTVVVPMRNDQEYLPDFLASLVEQTCKNFNLVLVDDYSEDGTFEVAQYLTEPLAKRAVVVRTENAVGIREAYDTGLHVAKERGFGVVCAVCITPRTRFAKDYLQRVCDSIAAQVDAADDSGDDMPAFLPDLQSKQLELFKQFATFAEECGLTYYALGGTLLGAVRHMGFIPWDDDIDLGLPRADYDRLIKLIEDDATPFNARTFQTSPDFYERFPQLIDESITVVRRDRSIPEITGAWVDFFPLDGAPANPRMRTIWSKWMRLQIGIHRLSCIDINGFGLATVNKSVMLSGIVKLYEAIPFGKCIDKRWALHNLDRIAQTFCFERSDWVNHSMSSRYPYMFPKEWYEPGAWYLFEDTEIFGPSNFDAVLSQLYGDYLMPPSDEDKGKHFREES